MDTPQSAQECVKEFHPTPITLSGSHVILEPIRQDHADGLYRIGQEEADWDYLPRTCFRDLEDAQSWVRECVDRNETHAEIVFTLVQPESGDVMGSTRYLDIRRPDRGLEIGWTWVGRAYQRSAVNTEAKFLLLSNAFENLGAHRVQLKCDQRNVRSQAAIERLGAVREGVLRQHMVTHDDIVRETVMYSIVADEWHGIKDRLLHLLNQ